jgi:glycosyltransferase involved in cell wall biosynthesis
MRDTLIKIKKMETFCLSRPAGSNFNSVSIVIPVYNEVDNVEILFGELLPCLEAVGCQWEVIFVNDGSTDGTGDKLDSIAPHFQNVRIVHFRRNFGQTAAMMAGIDYSQGDIIVPMDGDMQNDPKDISLLLAKLSEGYDVVSGWRRNRQDNSLTRRLPSIVANWLISRLSGVHLNDYGCTLKAYRREILQGFRLYGEMHRFVPIFASWQGARIAELPVRHNARKFGSSKYGLNRIFKVLYDLLLVKFLTHYGSKPIYVFGAVASFLFMGAFLAGAYSVYLKVFLDTSFVATPLPMLVSMGFIGGLTCTLMGLMAEVLVRIYYESQGKRDYVVAKLLNFNEAD